MAHFDMLVAQMKLFHRKLSKAKNLQEYQSLTKELAELLELYDKEKQADISSPSLEHHQGVVRL